MRPPGPRSFFKEVAWLVGNILIYAALCLGCILMLQLILGYTSFEDSAQFLAFKQDVVTIPLWKAAFYIHVFSAIVALFAGFTQFSGLFLKQSKKLHRIFGYIYVWNILLINAPMGMILAIYANGGYAGKAAFILLDVLWFVFTLKALRAALVKNFSKHRDYMIRSYALTFSAITLRAWKPILMGLVTINPTELYVLYSWMGFVPNLLFAEYLIHRIHNRKLKVNEKADTPY